MKRILHILAQRPEKTGSGMFLQALLREGQQQGYEQSVIAGIPAAADGPYFDDSIPFYPVRFETAELPFPVAGMTDIMPYISTMYRHMTSTMYEQWRQAFSRALSRAVAEFQPDIILANHIWLLAALTKELFPHIPMIAICHGTDLRQMELAPQFAAYVKNYSQQIEHIAALHEPQKENIIRTYGIPASRITVVGVGYENKVFYSSLSVGKSEPIQLVYAGKLNYSKGVPSLLRAYDQVSKKYPATKLILAGAGTGAQCEHIRDMVQERQPAVSLAGQVPQPRLAELFRHSQLFVFPSFFEGLPLVLTEALACGMRVVTTDLPGVRAFFGDAIDRQGLAEYVRLPRLRTIDQPVETDLPAFEQRFAAAMERQLQRIYDDVPAATPETTASLDSLTWAGVFRKIEALF